MLFHVRVFVFVLGWCCVGCLTLVFVGVLVLVVHSTFFCDNDFGGLWML